MVSLGCGGAGWGGQLVLVVLFAVAWTVFWARQLRIQPRFFAKNRGAADAVNSPGPTVVANCVVHGCAQRHTCQSKAAVLSITSVSVKLDMAL